MSDFPSITVGQVEGGIFHARNFEFQDNISRIAQLVQDVCLSISSDYEYSFSVDILNDKEIIKVEDKSNDILITIDDSNIRFKADTVESNSLLDKESPTLFTTNIIDTLIDDLNISNVNGWGILMHIAIPYEEGKNDYPINNLADIFSDGFYDFANDSIGEGALVKKLEYNMITEKDNIFYEITSTASYDKESIIISLDTQEDVGHIYEFTEFSRKALSDASEMLKPFVVEVMGRKGIDLDFLKSGVR